MCLPAKKKRVVFPRPSQKGIALLIVVSILTVIGIMGVAFAFSMHLETKESSQFALTSRARYAAEAGVAYARSLLEEDKHDSRVDDLSEGWNQYLKGADADTDNDRVPESRWWLLKDSAQETVGRYALQLADETGKANLNAAYANPAATLPESFDLVRILQAAGLDSQRAQAAASAIEQYRNGQDGKPGIAGRDDDADGAIDEADEYQPLGLSGDDRAFSTLEEVASVAKLAPEELKKLRRVATVYSWDSNVSLSGLPRLNVNTATAEELLSALLEAGVENPWQAAVNIADALDSDFDISHVTKSSQPLQVPNQGALGAWAWQDNPQPHYESNVPGGEALSWTVSVPTGSFRIMVRGLSGMKVGDITVAGQTKLSADSGDSLGIFSLEDMLQVTVANHEPEGTTCAFAGIELVTEGTKTGIPIRGVEPVRFNELMVEPVIFLNASKATFDVQGSDWGCPLGASFCTNSGVGEARWSWTDLALPPGRYYVHVYASVAGQTVGEVRLDSTTQLLINGQRHPSTLVVGSDHKVVLRIGKAASEGTYTFSKAALSVQPDGEYVELINLSGQSVDVSGWTIEGELAGGRLAVFPNGSLIKPHGLLLAAVDLDDHQEGMAGNGISARSVWEISADTNAVQLSFPSGAPSPEDDWLKISIPAGTPTRLTLRNGESVVDEIEYPLPLTLTSGFQSLEKADPSVVTDADGDGVDDGWFASNSLYTPGLPNDNDGLKEVVNNRTIIHDPQKEVTVPNRPLGGVGELAGIPSGRPWKPLSSADLAKIVDRLTVDGYRLEAEGHAIDESNSQTAWQEKEEGCYLHVDPTKAGIALRLSWNDLVNGPYRVSLYGRSGEYFSMHWQLADGSYSDWSPELSSDAQGRVVIGQLMIGSGTMPANRLTVEVRCASTSGICHVDCLRLDPRLLRVGPANVNTAAPEVLLALPGATQDLVSRIIANRPYGDKASKARGIGDLLIGDTLGGSEEDKLAAFKRLAHLLTTRSEVFQILSLGQVVSAQHPEASQRIEAIVQR